MLSFALKSILNVAACKVSKHGIDFHRHSSLRNTQGRLNISRPFRLFCRVTL